MGKTYGKMVNGEDALKFFGVLLLDNIPEEVKDDDFVDAYQEAYNRINYAVNRLIPIRPKVVKAVTRSFHDYYVCGECGNSLEVTDNHCSECGRQIGWDSIRCLTK